MLTRFLEHTRCPEAIIADFRLGAGTVAGAVHQTSTAAGDGGPDTPAQAALLVAALLERSRSGSEHWSSLAEIDRAIGILREERYLNNSVTQAEQSGAKSLVRSAYYAVRPLLPVAVRKYLQRAALRGWSEIPFPKWPVDTSTEDLIDATWRILLRSTGARELPFIWFWPDSHASACIMTHDVETAAGRDFCSTMMQMEHRVGLRSAFEVVPEERYSVPSSFLQEIRDRDCEVCLHGLNHDGRLFSSEALFLGRAAKINAYAREWGAVGFRSPVMYRNLQWIHKLEFSYDMSVPNVGHLDPQRGGCATVMPYFINDLVELPLTTIQDYSLFNILQSRSLELWKRQIDIVRARHGLINFIIHPDYVNESWSTNVYAQLLDHLSSIRSKENVWLPLPRDVADWWRTRRSMRLVTVGGTWTVQGSGAERARIAYASLEGDRIAYRLG